MKKIPCVMMRGGTSRGAFLLAEHLPEDQTQRADESPNDFGKNH